MHLCPIVSPSSCLENRIVLLMESRKEVTFWKVSPQTNFPKGYILVLGRTWFGSEVRSVFWGSVGSRFGFWGQNEGSGGSRFGFKVRRTFPNLFDLELCLYRPLNKPYFQKYYGWKNFKYFFLRMEDIFSEIFHRLFWNSSRKKISHKILLKISFVAPEKRFEVRSFKVRFGCFRGSGGSVGSRFGYAEVREVRGSEFSGSTQH